MKKLTFMIGIACVVGLSACSTQKRMTETPGIYTGTLPCADCDGIAARMDLKGDYTYNLSETYVGKGDGNSIRENGNFNWDRNKIVLSQDGTQYRVSKNKLRQLDPNGKKIRGLLREHYILKKADMRLVRKYWQLVEVDGKPVTSQGKEAHIMLRANGNKVEGSGNCNNFAGTFETQKMKRIKFSKLAATRMACPDMGTDALMFDALEGADRYHFDGDNLILRRGGKVVAKFVYVKK